MVSNNRRSAQVINDHLPIEEASGEYRSDRRRFGKMAAIIQGVISESIFFIWAVTYLLKNQSYMYKTNDETDLRLLLIIRRVTVK
jgi:hypothetical protein